MQITKIIYPKTNFEELHKNIDKTRENLKSKPEYKQAKVKYDWLRTHFPECDKVGLFDICALTLGCGLFISIILGSLKFCGSESGIDIRVQYVLWSAMLLSIAYLIFWEIKHKRCLDAVEKYINSIYEQTNGFYSQHNRVSVLFDQATYTLDYEDFVRHLKKWSEVAEATYVVSLGEGSEKIGVTIYQSIDSVLVDSLRIVIDKNNTTLLSKKNEGILDFSFIDDLVASNTVTIEPNITQSN